MWPSQLVRSHGYLPIIEAISHVKFGYNIESKSSFLFISMLGSSESFKASISLPPMGTNPMVYGFSWTKVKFHTSFILSIRHYQVRFYILNKKSI